MSNMKNIFSKQLFIFFVTIFITQACGKQHTIPRPDHIVIAILENHAYSQIIGSVNAPYINSLVNDSFSANFINSYAIKHPSQPNYLNLYSGSNQGVNDNHHPPKAPFITANLGRQLFNAGKSYATYSEDLPVIGYNGDSSGYYVRKHNPAANWMGKGINQIPFTTNRPFTAFPIDYSKLPTVSIIIPNLNNDMHDGSISTGDNWLKEHLNNYVQWAKVRNSLFILTFDEDDNNHNNHIVTIFTGEMVKKGQYSDKIIHYNILRTIEDMYGLSYAGNTSIVKPITDCLK